ncbi:hypothetical protein C805_02132 [Eubacterium sp. 14-2]|uniref:penicillin-binding transpeptidase domain-containing protein n=1 Tax=Eubacterium sp. 14-2 TaxID=1235790 RepID=UPI00033D3620|nr:penicillin-binding protein 2 [Eubacterium sp. 14-2]EOT25503.1 hypothetical protein C805_02132 [Eubacterium sp. 14-2]
MAERKRRPGKKKEPTKFSRKMKKKLLVMFSCVMVMLFALIGRLTYIEQVKGEEYKKQVLSQQGYESQSIPFQRGEILDSKGTVLASSVDVYNVILDCRLINEETYDLESRKKIKKYVEPTVEALLQCFPDVTEEEVMAALTEKADSRYFVLRKKLHYEEIREFQELESKVDKKGKKVNPNVQGVWFEKEYQREYPYGNLASKVLGFTTSGNEGIGGLEDYYNDVLNGINGRQYGFLNSDNNFEKTIKDPINGRTLILTMDLNIQKIVQERIAEFQEEHRDEEHEGPGSNQTGVIVMNPQNGEILAMSDSLVYDLNNPRDLSLYYTEEEINGFSEQEQLDKLNKIWQNYCITYTYEPGSTTKPFTVATALETGKTREWYDCDGVEKIGGHEIHCVQRSGHGPQTMEESLMNSCNDAMMAMAFEVGKEAFYKYQNIFNFGLRTNIDLPGEARTDTLIYTVDNTNDTSLATNAFGQNFNVTMVQLASAFSSLINGGYYYQPHLVKKIVDDNGNTVQSFDKTVLKQTISRQTSDTIKEYLYKTVSEGTGKSAKVAGYSMGGKTGTAQKGNRDDKKYVVSFIGFAPVENPEVLVYVVIDEANVILEKQSSALATELAKRIFTDLLPYMNIFQDEETEELENPEGTEGMPEGENPEGNEGGNPEGNEGEGTPEGGNPEENGGENTPEGGNPEENGGENTPEGGNPEENGGEGTPGEGPPGQGGEEGGAGQPENPGGDEYPAEGIPEAMPEGGEEAPPEE